MGYIYLIQSAFDGSLYFGSTNNINDRLVRHNTGRSKATSHRKPWVLLNIITFSTIAEARSIEQKMKSQKVKLTASWFMTWSKYGNN